MNKRFTILIGVGAIVLIGAIAVILRNTAAPAGSDPKQTTAEQSGGATSARDTSKVTTQQAPMQRLEPFTPPPSAGTGAYKPPK